MGGRLLPVSDIAAFALPTGGTLRFVNPEDHGFGAIVVTTSEHPPGAEVSTHKHTCSEIFAVTRPRHMTLNEILVRPTAQP
jgi:hypothetical protein